MYICFHVTLTRKNKEQENKPINQKRDIDVVIVRKKGLLALAFFAGKV